MAVPEWLFGPSGDLRPLPAPDVDVVNTVERFGGVHNAINGARTVDVLGHRANYQFELPYLSLDEYFRLESLYTETIPGPFWLVDPLRKNLVSREAATTRPADAYGRGVSVDPSTGALTWIKVLDSPISWSNRGVRVTNIPETSRIRFDTTTRFPIVAMRPCTASVYVKSDIAVDLNLALVTFYEDLETETITGPSSSVVAGEWTRISYTFSELAAATSAYLAIDTSGIFGSAEGLEIMTPQVELGTSVTDPALGGGSLRVVIGSMDTVSPRYPLQTVSLELLEV